MTPKSFKTRPVERGRHSTYLRKAHGFLRASEYALSLGDWDAAGLNAVHAAISAADALLVFHARLRPAGDSHNDVIGLLHLHIKDPQTGPRLLTLSKVLGYKHLAAYEDRCLTEAEARDAEKLSRRFLDWARSRLP